MFFNNFIFMDLMLIYVEEKWFNFICNKFDDSVKNNEE